MDRSGPHMCGTLVPVPVGKRRLHFEQTITPWSGWPLRVAALSAARGMKSLSSSTLALFVAVLIFGLVFLLQARPGLSESIVRAPESSASAELVRDLRARLAAAEKRATHAEELAARGQQSKCEEAHAIRTSEVTTVQPEAAAASATQEVYIHTISSVPAKPGDLMMMTYATGGVREMLWNWVLHVQRLGLPVLVAAMDKAVVEQCSTQLFHCLDWSHTATGLDKSYVRGSFDGFRALGVRKLDALLPVLRLGVHVVLSDVDCVWSSSPLPMFHGRLPGFEDFAHADLIVATDCMSPEDDDQNSGCFYDTVDKNTGVLAVRATPDGIAAMAEWQIRLMVGQKDEQDQTTFNDLLDGNGRGHRWGMSLRKRTEFRQFAVEWCGRGKGMRGINEQWVGSGAAKHTEGSRRIHSVCLPNATKTARVGIFPITAVAGGHTFFVQQLHSPTAYWPMAVHATYQFGDQMDYPFGKRQRFRDWGMWLADNDDEMITGSNYLVLEDEMPITPATPWVGAKDYHARGRQHVDHLQQLRQRLAHGFALARVLNRTVVLPTLWCYCDKFWHRLSECAISSAKSSQPLPFVCPMDHVLDPSFLHGDSRARTSRPRAGMLASRADGPYNEGLPFRGRYWLRQLGAHPRIGLSQAWLRVAEDASAEPMMNGLRQVASEALLHSTRSTPKDQSQAAEAARRAVSHKFIPGSDGPLIRLPAGRTDAQLRQAMQLYDNVRLVHVSMGDAARLLRCFQVRKPRPQPQP